MENIQGALHERCSIAQWTALGAAVGLCAGLEQAPSVSSAGDVGSKIMPVMYDKNTSRLIEIDYFEYFELQIKVD